MHSQWVVNRILWGVWQVDRPGLVGREARNHSLAAQIGFIGASGASRK